MCNGKPGERVACATSDQECAFAFRTRGDSDACFKVDRRIASTSPALQVFNQTPFWIMNVDKRVIADHGDIWNLSFLSMLGELMAPRGFFDPTAAPMRIQLR